MWQQGQVFKLKTKGREGQPIACTDNTTRPICWTFEALCGTFVRVRSSVRSLRNSAQPRVLSNRRRTRPNAAPSRQAGGDWFEPSTAHLNPRN